MLHGFFTLRQRTGCLLQQWINWQIINLIQRIHQALLDLRQTTAYGRNNRITAKFLHLAARRGFRIEVEIDIQRAGHQIAGFKRTAQPAIH